MGQFDIVKLAGGRPVTASDAIAAPEAKKSSSINSLGKTVNVVRVPVKGREPNPCCVAFAFIAASIALIGVALLIRYAVGIKALVPTAGANGNILYSMVTIHQRGAMIAGATLLGIGGVGTAVFAGAAYASSR